MTYRKKLIEVALPLVAINRESAREKSIRHGHPSTLHLWWARRPLAAARAVIFAQMVDDPSSHPERFPTEAAQNAERQRLFDLIERLVDWDNITDDALMEAARIEIRHSWADWCMESGEDPAKLPPFHDPFAGGGALPLEAQRLGLEAHASDLNPVAVTINKAMIEIPAKFAGRKPVHPGSEEKLSYKAAEGLAEDVRFYGHWMRTEAKKRIGHLYPEAKIVRGEDGSFRHATAEEAQASRYNPNTAVESRTVIAWLWARTVASPNPAAGGVHIPLISSFWLSTKPGKEAWVEPVISTDAGPDGYRFEIRTGKPEDKNALGDGTKTGRGGNFRCILTGTPVPEAHVKAESLAGRMSARLLAVVVEGDRSRIYLPPTMEMEQLASSAKPTWKPDQLMPANPRWFSPPGYGLTTYGDIFTPRQLVTLTTLSDLVSEARECIRRDAIARGWGDDAQFLNSGGTAAAAYAEAVSVYLAFAVDRVIDRHTSIATWDSSPSKLQLRNTFSRQAIPMTWDFGEGNPFCSSSGTWTPSLDFVAKAIESFPVSGVGFGFQADAAGEFSTRREVISSDPPYYDNIGYADLSDFFYVWLRRSLQPVFPDIFGTVLVPKAQELVATPYRHGGKEAAEAFFMDGMTRAIHGMAERSHPAFPVSIYYAFKQAEGEGEDGSASTGWETFLEAVIRAGFSIHGTWPMRTELSNRMIGRGTNALASSIILVCRKKPADAKTVSRRDFLAELKHELPTALRLLQRGNIAPVDLAQAAIGPGIAVFSHHAKVLESDGTSMPVRTALMLINQTLDEVLAEQEGEFDADTRFIVAWHEQFGLAEGAFGEADVLARAKNTAVAALVEDGLVQAKSGKVRLVTRDELPVDWDPQSDDRLSNWECVQHLIRALLKNGEEAAARILAKLPSAIADVTRDLAYRLYIICERKKWSQEAAAYNALVVAWPELVKLAEQQPAPRTDSTQSELGLS